MLAVLSLTTLGVVLLPMLPALREWLWPSDVQPLPIDEADALDPPYLARSFADRLSEAVRAGATRLGSTELVACPADGAPLPLSSDEQAAHASHRAWHAEGDLALPGGMAFYAEVAATGDLRVADHGIHKGLWAGGTLRLGAHASVLRWAHGEEVFVGESCHLAGRVTAGRAMALAPGASFMLVHAPRLQFLPQAPRPDAAAPAGPALALAGVRWDAGGRRAVSDGALAVAAGTAWRGDLVCHGDLTLHDRCRVDGSLKVHGRLSVGPGCTIEGNVFAQGAIQLGEACAIRGVLMSETGIVLRSGCAVGVPAAPTTVAAPRIDVCAGVEICGTVWASGQGRCVAPSGATEAGGSGIGAPPYAQAAAP